MSATPLRFTKTAIDAIVPPAAGRRIYADPSAPTGLRLRVTSNGAKAWYWLRKVNGKPVCAKIGDVADVTPDQAKRRAQEFNGGAAAGENPSAAKREAREAPTLAELWTHYETTYATPHKKASSAAEDRRNWKNHLEPWGKGRRLREITPADVKALHVRIGAESGKVAANRVLALLSGMFSKGGADLGVDRRDNPARDVPRFPEQERDRVLSGDELQRVMAALAAADPAVGDFIKVALYTGARRANVLAMKWEDVNLKRGTWRIPGELTKGGDPLVVALAPVVVELLNARPDGSPFVFPVKRVTPDQVAAARELRAAGHTTRAIAGRLGISQTQAVRVLRPDFAPEPAGPMGPPVGAWEKILKAANIWDAEAGTGTRTTFHDLRRTFATWMIRSGASLTVVAAAMGHKDIRTTQKHYAWADLDTVKNATVAGVAAIAAAAAAPAPPAPAPAAPADAAGDPAPDLRLTA